MMYAIVREEGKLGGACRTDLKTIRGYVRWASGAARAQVERGKYAVLEVYQSEHPDHIYGNDKLLHVNRMLIT